MKIPIGMNGLPTDSSSYTYVSGNKALVGFCPLVRGFTVDLGIFYTFFPGGHFETLHGQNTFYCMIKQ